VNQDGTFNLRVRPPDAIITAGKYLEITGVRFNYGADVIQKALVAKQALSYRFLRNNKGWRVMITTVLPEIKSICLAVSEIDRFGNIAGSRVIPLVTYGKSTDQAKALIGDAIKEIVDQAVATRKPIVIENLDFSKKKATLEGEDPKQARMLSSLSYNKIIQTIKTAAYRAGIEVIEVNPAYTSLIGSVNFQKKYGISVHQAAALAIARRGAGFRERPNGAVATIATSKGDHVTFALPVRNRAKHVWSFWSGVQKIKTAALAAHFRPLQKDPLKPKPSRGKDPIFSVKLRDANRQQNCSAGVIDDIPW
jgi:IS605 OrfB family transposase